MPTKMQSPSKAGRWRTNFERKPENEGLAGLFWFDELANVGLRFDVLQEGARIFGELYLQPMILRSWLARFDGAYAVNSARPRRHHHYNVRQKYRFLYAMGNENHCLLVCLLYTSDAADDLH